MKIGFALEYSLGHITHAQNLKRFLSEDAGVEPIYIDIPFDGTAMPPLLKPIFKDNWSVRASAAARAGLTPHISKLSACMFHTQITSLFSTQIMRRVPSIVSLDATPLQYDSLGSFYKHKPGPAPMESLKKRMNESAFAAAEHLVTWSDWAKQSLIDDYAVTPNKVTVIPPGIDLKLWRVERDDERMCNAGKNGITFLFVGGDFERKGGPTLLSAFRSHLAAFPGSRLLLVSKTLPDGFDEPGVEIFRGMTPNSPELRALYSRADVFAFPTLGDCLPLAVMEALAAGLPVITSDVGALSEAVTDGVNGVVVAPGEATPMVDAMSRLATDCTLRRNMSAAAVARASHSFDAQTNYLKLINILKAMGSNG